MSKQFFWSVTLMRSNDILAKLFCSNILFGMSFVVSSLIIKKFLIVSKKSKSYLNKIKKFSGIILLITGILIVTGKLQTIGFYLIEFFPILQKLG